MGNVISDVVSTMFSGGLNDSVLKFLNGTLGLLTINLFVLGFFWEFNIHIMIMLFLDLGLLFLVNWLWPDIKQLFAHKAANQESAPKKETKKEKQKKNEELRPKQPAAAPPHLEKGKYKKERADKPAVPKNQKNNPAIQDKKEKEVTTQKNVKGGHQKNQNANNHQQNQNAGTHQQNQKQPVENRKITQKAERQAERKRK